MTEACSHEYITKLYDTFEDSWELLAPLCLLQLQDQTSIYLALEYCDGGDFGDKATG